MIQKEMVNETRKIYLLKKYGLVRDKYMRKEKTVQTT